ACLLQHARRCWYCLACLQWFNRVPARNRRRSIRATAKVCTINTSRTKHTPDLRRNRGNTSMRQLTLGLILGGVGCLLLAGCGHSGAHAANSAAGKAAASIERVTAAKPKRKTLRMETTQPAWIEAFEQSPLYARVAGYVDKVHVDIGDPIKKDQPLVT